MRDWKIRSRLSRLFVMGSLAGALGLVIAGTLFHLPLVPFRPVCVDHNADTLDRFRVIEGELTPEFVGALLAQSYHIDRYRIRAHRRTLYQTPVMWLPYTDLSRTFVDIDRYRWWPVWLISWNAVDALFHRRIVDGSITPAMLAEYTIKERSVDDRPPRQMRPSECGLMQEFALVGGRFAEPTQQ